MGRESAATPEPPEAPFTWEELVAIVRAERVEVLGRERGLQQRYEAWISETKRTWRSVGDFCCCKFVGFSETTDAATGLRCALPKCTAAASDHPRLFPNDWPYGPRRAFGTLCCGRGRRSPRTLQRFARCSERMQNARDGRSRSGSFSATLQRAKAFLTCSTFKSSTAMRLFPSNKNK